MSYPSDVTHQLVDICHRLYTKGFVTATDGNVSARLGNGNILTTRTSINKGMVTDRDIVEVTRDGEMVSGTARPSTELGMHLFIYQQRPDVEAVVHAHPPYATGFATAGLALDQCLFPEVIVGLGAVPLATYATPSTSEVSESMAPYVKTSDAILLANHGVVAYGSSLLDAFFKMEKVEHAAHITFVARMLGGENVLSSDEVEKLRRISVESYGKDFSEKIACSTEESTSEEMSETELRNYVAERLAHLRFP
jgi:L-fuculose-phosphate aldolase